MHSKNCSTCKYTTNLYSKYFWPQHDEISRPNVIYSSYKKQPKFNASDLKNYSLQNYLLFLHRQKQFEPIFEKYDSNRLYFYRTKAGAFT